MRTLFLAFVLAASPASAQTPFLAWDAASSPAVTGYAVSIDGVRADLGMSPIATDGTCNCQYPLPVSGGKHVLNASAYNASGETWAAPISVGPIAVANGPYSGQAGAPVAVSGSGSGNPIGSITSYAWTWGDGTFSSVGSPAASHAYTSAGTFAVKLLVTDNGGATASTSTSAAITDGQTPPPTNAYLGAPVALPGTVQAENFDNGGEGVAYHDLTTVNSGGAYRTTAVDIQPNSTGINVGWAAAGEWLNYAVTVTTAGTYTATFRLASSVQGGTFHLEANGVNLTGALTAPNTGGWENWVNVTKVVTLAAGSQTLRLVLDTGGTNGYTANFDFIQFTAASSTSDTQAPSIPTLTNIASAPGQVILAWAASTDNVGVTSYTVDRCTGSSCTAFAPLVTVAGTGYSDTGLASGTLYNYRVRATDAAKNFSSPSGIVAIGWR